LIHINFLWGWGSEGRKIPWIAWDKVCLPIERSGLGVKDIFVFNVALIAKWNGDWVLRMVVGGEIKLNPYMVIGGI